MPLRSPPRRFNEAIRRLFNDDSFEFMWSDKLHRWLLGRREGIPLIPERRFHGCPPDFNVMRIIETAGGNYMELDQRVIDQAAWGDPWRRPRGSKDIIAEVQEHNNKREADLERRYQDAREWEKGAIDHAARERVLTFGGQKKLRKYMPR